MKDRIIKLLLVLNLMVLTAILLRPSLSLPSADAQSSSANKDNPELTRLMDEDQSDRTPPAGKSIDWKVVDPRDEAISLSEEFLRDRYEKESDFHFNSLLSGDGVAELRSDL